MFDCNPPSGIIADRQLVTRDNVMKAMQTAYYIAICDDGASPHKRDKCVFAKRGTEPFENLAKGHVINANRDSCNVDCLKKWWTGDNLRIGWMTFTCKATNASNFRGALIYHACGNYNGLHMFAQEGRWVCRQGYMHTHVHTHVHTYTHTYTHTHIGQQAKCAWNRTDNDPEKQASLWIQTKTGNTHVCMYLYTCVCLSTYLCMYVSS